MRWRDKWKTGRDGDPQLFKGSMIKQECEPKGLHLLQCPSTPRATLLCSGGGTITIKSTGLGMGGAGFWSHAATMCLGDPDDPCNLSQSVFWPVEQNEVCGLDSPHSE